MENTLLLKKNTIVNVENKIILAYSLKKINTNPIEAYSMLNPDTSSDSPSAKSKGVRLVSASSKTIQITAVVGTIKMLLKELSMWSFIFILMNNTINCMITRARLISYEIVWATPRIEPIIAYFLLDAQPLNKIGYTPRLKTMRREIMLKGQLLKKLFNGVTTHRVTEIISIKTGDKENIFQFTL